MPCELLFRARYRMSIAGLHGRLAVLAFRRDFAKGHVQQRATNIISIAGAGVMLSGMAVLSPLICLAWLMQFIRKPLAIAIGAAASYATIYWSSWIAPSEKLLSPAARLVMHDVLPITMLVVAGIAGYELLKD